MCLARVCKFRGVIGECFFPSRPQSSLRPNMNGNTHMCISAGILDERVPNFSVLVENVVQWNQSGRNNWNGKTMEEIDLRSSLCKSINTGGSLIDRIRLALRDGFCYEYTFMQQTTDLLGSGLLISCWESVTIINSIKTSCVIWRGIRILVLCLNITSYGSLNDCCFADMILGLHYRRIKHTKLDPRGV